MKLRCRKKFVRGSESNDKQSIRERRSEKSGSAFQISENNRQIRSITLRNLTVTRLKDSIYKREQLNRITQYRQNGQN